MQRVWSWLAVELGKHAVIVTAVGLLITIALGFGITKLEFATGQDSYLNQDEQVYIDNVEYQELFGGQAMLTVITMDEGHTVAELFDEEGRRQFEALHEELTATDRFRAVVTPLTVLEFNQSMVTSDTGQPTDSIAGQALQRALGEEEVGSPEAEARFADAQETLARVGAIPEDERTFDNPDWVEFLMFDNQGDIRLSQRPFFPDPQHAQIIVRLKGNLSLDDEGADAAIVEEATADLEFDNATVVTTGAPVLLRDINDYLRGGMLTLGGLAVVAMAVILLLFFDVRWRLLPLLIITIGVIWGFGAAGYLGIPLTIVTIAGLPVLLGVGIDYAIQVHARVEEEVVIDRADHPIQETTRNLAPALIVVIISSVAAFLALRFAKVPMIRDFGLLLAVGIVLICIASILLPIAILGAREFRSPTKTGHDYREGALGRLVVKLGSLPTRTAIPLALVSLLILFAGVSVEDELTLQTDPVQWVNQESGTIEDIRKVEAEVNSSSELGIYFTADDVFSDEFVAFSHEFTNDQLSTYPDDLLTGSSMTAVVTGLLKVPGASDIAPTGDEVRAAYDVAPRDIQVSTIADGGEAANLIFRTAAGDLEARAEVVRDIRETVDPPAGVNATPSGLAVVGVGLVDNLLANRAELTYLAILFAGAWLALRLRSLVRSVLSLVPVLIAVGASSLVAYLLDIKLSPMTAVGGPLVVAVCTEFTALILLRFVEERQRGLPVREAADVAASRTGRAFIVSALTSVAGVAVLSLSSLPLLRDFGRIVALNVSVALLSALVILPPLLIWAEERGWVTRGLLREPEPMIPGPRSHEDLQPEAT